MKRNNRYWQKRADQRMYEYIYDAEKDADLITKAYLQSSNYLSNEAQKVLKTFERDNGLSEAEARRILNRIGVSALLQKYVDAPAYAYRIRRLEALREDIGKQCQRLYGITNTGVTKILQSTVEKAYPRTMFDIQKGAGFGFSFSAMPTSRINEILRQSWSGEHYSKRIWDNVDKLADTLKEEVLVGFMTGRSTGKTANAIQERMGCGSMEARRLVRTETNYVANQAELDSYRECGIDRYRFLATLDSRTSEICQQLDGKEFPVGEAKAGVNLPPMHPNCRSTTVAVFEDEDEENLMRRARDPLTGETELVPADMTYEQWIKKYMRPKKQLKNQAESGIITSGRDNMGISIEIDDFTPCLVEKSTGKIVNTKYSLANKSELKLLNRQGWNFNWVADDLKDSNIYKLTLEDDDIIQGLVALKDMPNDYAVHLKLAESAPLNIGKDKRYEGVGGHLFAIAAKVSMDNGYGGFIYFEAKNMELVRHYQEMFGGKVIGGVHQYRMVIDEDAAERLLNKYTLKGE